MPLATDVRKPEFRVIVVEDDETIRHVLSEFLKFTFRVETAANKKEAMDKITITPDMGAILLDLILPNGAGLCVLQEFQRAFPGIPIVVISGSGQNALEIIQAGAQDYLEKGHFDRAQLLETVGRAIARHQVRRIFQPVTEQLEEIKAASPETKIAAHLETLVDSVNRKAR